MTRRRTRHVIVAGTVCLAILTAAPIADAAEWWGKGNRIAYGSCPAPGTCDLYSIKADGTGSHPFFEDADFEDYASWSPSGKRLTYQSGQDVWVMRKDGTHRRNLTDSARPDYTPTWSADGERIIFASVRSEGQELVSMRASDGGGVHPLTDGAFPVAQPDCSPKGKKIVFQGNPGTQKLYTMGGDGSHLHVLHGTEGEYSPAWAPDGKLIATVHNISGGSEIHLIRARDGDSRGVVPTPETFTNTPAWSPDGSRIVYAGYDGAQNDIYTVALDGSHHRNLTNTAYPEFFYD